MRRFVLASLGLVAALFAVMAYVRERSSDARRNRRGASVTRAIESDAAATADEVPLVVERSATSAAEPDSSTSSESLLRVPADLELSVDGGDAPLSLAIPRGALEEALARLR